MNKIMIMALSPKIESLKTSELEIVIKDLSQELFIIEDRNPLIINISKERTSICVNNITLTVFLSGIIEIKEKFSEQNYNLHISELISKINVISKKLLNSEVMYDFFMQYTDNEQDLDINTKYSDNNRFNLLTSSVIKENQFCNVIKKDLNYWINIKNIKNTSEILHQLDKLIPIKENN